RGGGSKAQCLAQLAPWSIQRLSVSTCCAVSFLLTLGGGMTSVSSWLLTRRYSSLSALLPGTMTVTPSLPRKAPSLVSRRSLALRAAASGPWHWKQWLDRIGSTSRLKSTVGPPDCWVR